MEENEILEPTPEPMPEPTPEEIEEWERERAEAWEAKIRPYRELGIKIRAAAEINAEQDDLIADILYEQIINEMEE